jgi:nitrogen fixation protein NifQ
MSQTLLACARHPHDPATLALAGVLSTSFERHGLALLPMPGRDMPATRALLAHWFPGADNLLGLDWTVLAHAHRPEPRCDEIDDLVSLLTTHANPSAGTAAQTEDVAWALACASLGQDHLWQDLRLPSRTELSQLMQHWFTPLAVRNVLHMKWKKFLYKQLCERENLFICKSPSCQVCTDHALCFGPEHAAPALATLATPPLP